MSWPPKEKSSLKLENFGGLGENIVKVQATGNRGSE